MNSTVKPLMLKSAFALLVLWALLLHGCLLFSAGALWRDEANSVNQSRVASWRAMRESLRYDSFPMLYPAILRTFFPVSQPFSAEPFRVLGFGIGVALLISVMLAAKVLDSRLPVVALALLAIDPVVISEGDSVRPYGIGLLCLLWCFCAYGRLLINPATPWLLIASAASILAVQASYANALVVGVLAGCAALQMLAQRKPRMLWRALLPGFLAAVSLVPYAGTLRQAHGWISIVNSEVNWLHYLKSYIRSYSVAFPIAWLLMTALGAYCLVRFIAHRPAEPSAPRVVIAYTCLAAGIGIVVQILLVQVMGVPPFPRYFLPGLLLTAFALDLLTQELKPSIRASAALFVLLFTAWPAWSWVKHRHTNVDIVAGVLGAQAGPSDLVVISPWFLHPSFQLYYSGSAPWVTVPDLPQSSVTRYDLLREAMMDPQREIRLYRRMRRTLAGGGAIWLVSQEHPSRPSNSAFPVMPALSSLPTGEDYVRFRSYWERMIIYRLFECCRPLELGTFLRVPVWEEEDLVLTRWHSDDVDSGNK